MKKVIFTIVIGLSLLTQSCEKENLTTDPKLAKVGDKYLDGYVVSTQGDGHGVIAKKAYPGSHHVKEDWYEAKSYEEGGWRLPSVNELSNMLSNYSLANDKMDLPSGSYWSATETSATEAKVVNFTANIGMEGGAPSYSKLKTSDNYVYIFKNY